MADIIKCDVQTYVEELINEEFSSKKNEEKTLSDKRRINTGEYFNQRRRSLCNEQ